MSSRNRPLLVLVPGLLGSEITVCKKNLLGQEEEVTIWGSNAKHLWHTLAFEPELLSTFPAVKTNILREISTSLSISPIYSTLLDFLKQSPPHGQGLIPGRSLLEFSYDWRQSNAETATILASRLRREYPKRKLAFLAHSMGGLVVRLLLGSSKNSDILERTSRVYQVASPLQGSVAAYETLKEKPTFSILADLLLKQHFHRQPRRLSALLDALRNLESLFEIMPRAEILIQTTGKSVSPFDPTLWPSYLRKRLQRAQGVARDFSRDLNASLTILYSGEQKTRHSFFVDMYGHILKDMRPFSEGDGTVTSSSATAFSDGHQLVQVKGKKIDHMLICRSAELKEAIATLIFSD